ncbi:MAG TPA: response regulator [Saprospiraceae bacterium]|nr:response regulator [Saprospiraceae bacterium]HMQ84704.1 response regulator [Saprospiraceae bacterium]
MKVLWIEDNAENDLYELTSPVYVDGRFKLDIAASASEAYFYLNSRIYDIVIIDIRIPPGRDEVWVKLHQQLQFKNGSDSSRLGLELLKSIFSDLGPQPNLKIHQNSGAHRYGVFTVEQREELEADLAKLNLAKVKYRRKNAMMPHTALLDFIREVAKNGQSSH